MPDRDPDPDEDELARAKARIAALEREVEDLREQDYRQRAQLEAATESTSFIVQGKLIEANERSTEILGYLPDELVGMTPLDFVAPESRELAIAKIRVAYEKPYEIVAIRKDGSRFPAEVCGRSVPYRDGVARVVVLRDVGERKQAESALRQAAVQQESLRAQAETLERLATPILPIHRDVVVVPLVGEMGEARCRGVTEVLIAGIAGSRARIAIIDITGVPSVDTGVADMILSATRAVRLLGVQVVLTGLGPDVARTLVTLGVDLSSMITKGTLQQGVTWALRSLG